MDLSGVACGSGELFIDLGQSVLGGGDPFLYILEFPRFLEGQFFCGCVFLNWLLGDCRGLFFWRISVFRGLFFLVASNSAVIAGEFATVPALFERKTFSILRPLNTVRVLDYDQSPAKSPVSRERSCLDLESVVGSSISRTFGDPIKIRSKYSRLRSPPDRFPITAY